MYILYDVSTNIVHKTLVCKIYVHQNKILILLYIVVISNGKSEKPIACLTKKVIDLRVLQSLSCCATCDIYHWASKRVEEFLPIKGTI